MINCCPPIAPINTGCDVRRQTPIRNIFVKKTKKGFWKVKIDDGKWVKALFDEKTQILTYNI